jgi:hypothetical protein
MSVPFTVRVVFLLFALAGNHARAQQSRVSDHGKTASRLMGCWGEYKVKLDFRKNFALDRPHRDDLFRFDQELELRWSYRHNDWISFLVERKVIGEHELYSGGRGRKSEAEPERGETWAHFENLFGRDLSLKIGRENFEEPRRCTR